MTANFTAPSGDCSDYFSSVGGATGGIELYQLPYPSSQTFYIWIGATVDSSRAGPIVAGTEYFLFNLVIDNAKTVGAPACSGCDEPAIIKLSSLGLMGIGEYRIGFGYADRGNVAQWQSPTSSCSPVPVRNRTWGTIKLLYR